MFEYDVDGTVDTPAEADATGPLPVFGLRYQMRVGDINGRVDDYELAFTYRFAGHWGVGAGDNQFTTRIEGTDPNSFDGVFSWRYGRLMLFASANF